MSKMALVEELINDEHFNIDIRTLGYNVSAHPEEAYIEQKKQARQDAIAHVNSLDEDVDAHEELSKWVFGIVRLDNIYSGRSEGLRRVLWVSSRMQEQSKKS